MGRVRVFYGHEGVVPPTGYRARPAAAPAAPEVDEVVSDDPNGEPVELVGELVEDGATVAAGGIVLPSGAEVPVGDDGLPVLGEVDEAADETPVPDESWTKADLLSFAEERGIDMTGAKKTVPLALARIRENLEES